MQEEVQARYPYQNLLRALGHLLDERAARAFRVVETAAHFIVSLEEKDLPGSVNEIDISHADLWQRDQTLIKSRGRGKAIPAQWSLEPLSREGFLRALGFELDDSVASNVVLDEIDDGLVLIYSKPATGKAFDTERKLVIVRRPEAESILAAAGERRERRSRWPFG